MTDSLRSSSTTRLERRPEATAYQVDDLLLMARDGRLRVPRFQRGLRWRDRDRLDLLDSIYRGFPIGTLLFWKRSADAASVSLGDLSLDAPARDDALWIVDGQQRIATLASTLLVPSQPDKRAVHFNLETEEFVYARPSAASRRSSRSTSPTRSSSSDSTVPHPAALGSIRRTSLRS